MNTVIVPVDFSETSFNAARYAVNLLKGHPGAEIILYHTFEKEIEEENSNENLGKLRNQLLKTYSANISILSDMGVFVTELEKLARHRQVDLIIMGNTGRSALAQVFMGSNTLKVAENKFCPVLIIPPNCEYRDLKNVMLTSDLKNVFSTTPSGPIKKILKTFNPNLHIVSVDSDLYVALTEEQESEKEKLIEMFAGFNPSFYFLRLFDVDEALSMFATDKNIDLIINIQKEHSLLHRLFNTNHIKNIVCYSTMPVLVVHE